MAVSGQSRSSVRRYCPGASMTVPQLVTGTCAWAAAGAAIPRRSAPPRASRGDNRRCIVDVHVDIMAVLLSVRMVVWVCSRVVKLFFIRLLLMGSLPGREHRRSRGGIWGSLASPNQLYDNYAADRRVSLDEVLLFL
jgi:hypothetical protein